jgi:signal transduction histidine kinase
MHFWKRRGPFNAVVNDNLRPAPHSRPAPLVAAATLLSKRNVYGLVWVDQSLNVIATYGALVDFVDIGEPVTSSVPVFVGLEADILALKDNKGTLLDLPIASIVTVAGPTPKLNFTALWSPEEDSYLVLVSRAGQVSNVELELSRQIRARLIAEAEVTHKSKALTKANVELERANRDLEEFASIISHDLKAPMRQLRYMIEDMKSGAERGATGPLPQDTLTGLHNIQVQSQRMSEMLSSLLEYCSAGRKDEVTEVVDTQAMVAAIVRSTPCPVGFTINTTGLWPRIETLRAPLDLILRNLIDNAIKHHDCDAGSIRLGCADAGDKLEIEIADDGPGIDPRHHTAIFLPFRRLETADRGANGQGMGLAFVKRWVEAAGGQIRLMSDPAARRGTRVLITWPKAPAT